MGTQTTKEKLIEVGANLVHKNGFNNTGIQQILKETGVPKGSFYFYFKSKEDFGLELVKHYQNFMDKTMESLFSNTEKSPLARLKDFFNFFYNFFNENNCEGGCPVGNLAQELSDTNETIRKQLETALSTMVNPVEELLKEAIAQEELDKLIEPKQTAEFIINSWEGAVMRMKVSKNIEHLKIAENYIFEKILK